MINLNKKFTGKKLLLLGTNTGTFDIVNYAKSQGAYIIVTDNLPPNKSPAKLIVDEAWPISTADVDTLVKLANDNNVNGVFAGVSEFNLEKALTLCERLGLPFYSTRQHWDMFTNKQCVKQLCQINGVPVAREYQIDSNFRKEDLRRIRYPVIVKPVDSSSGIGISTCYNEGHLRKGYAKAVSMSQTKQAIVEEFIKGEEFTACYTIKDSQISLTNVADRYRYLDKSGTFSLPQANISPSKYIDQYINELHTKMIKMLQRIGLTNGVIFMQGTRNNNGFYIFEANYRIPVNLLYRFTSRVNGINFMEMMVNCALTGKMAGYDLSLDNPRYNKCCCILEFVSKGGMVGEIMGLEEIRKIKNLIDIEKRYDVGDQIEKSGTLRQVLIKFYLIEDTICELINSIKEIQETVKVLDDKGQDMLLPTFDTNRINLKLGRV